MRTHGDIQGGLTVELRTCQLMSCGLRSLFELCGSCPYAGGWVVYVLAPHATMLPTCRDSQYVEDERVANTSTLVLITQDDECYTHAVVAHLQEQHICAHRVARACRRCDLNSWHQRWGGVGGYGTGAGWPGQPGWPDGAECYTHAALWKKYVPGKNRGSNEYKQEVRRCLVGRAFLLET